MPSVLGRAEIRSITVDRLQVSLICRYMTGRARSTHAHSISGLSGAGASSQQHLVTAQLLRLSTSGKKDTRLAEQVSALETILTSFGCAKTTSNPSATRYSSLLELHLNAQGRLSGAKVLAYGLDRTRFAKIPKGERSFHALYQLVAGASREERHAYHLLDDPAEYALFRKSTTFRLPPGVPLADDSIAFEDLRTAFKVLGFKPKHVASIYRVLSAILLLGNLDFAEHPEDAYDYQSESAWVTNVEVLEQVADLLGVASADLERSLTNRVRWVRKEMMATILRADGADQQRDSLMAALYSIVFAFVVETANHKLFPGDDAIAAMQKDGGTSILQFSQPGFTNHSSARPGSRSSVLIQALNGYDDFVHNYQTELARHFTTEQAFDGDAGVAARAQEDGLRVTDVLPADNGAGRIELLRGGRIGGKADKKPGGILGGMAKTCASLRRGIQPKQADTDLVAGMRDHFAAHPSFVANPSGPGARTAFAIMHWGGQMVAYDAYRFVETDCDALDPEHVAMLRSSGDPFVAKLVSGPGLAAEVHPIDDATLVAAQVSSMPLRRPSPVRTVQSFTPADGEQGDYTAPLLDPLAIYPVSTQINATTSQILGSILARTQQWNLIALLPNATATPRQVDARLLKAQVAALQLPELVARRNTVDWACDVTYEDFVDRHGLGISGQETARDSVASYAGDFGLDQSRGDFALGTSRLWLSWNAWRALEDRLRSDEPAEHRDRARETATQARGGHSADTSPPNGKKDSSDGSAAEGERGMLGYLPELGPSRSTVNVGYTEGGFRQSHGPHSGSVDDLLYDGGATPGSPNAPMFDYSDAAAQPGRTQSGFFSEYNAPAESYGLRPPHAPCMQEQSSGGPGSGFPSMGSFGGYGAGGGGLRGRDSEVWGVQQGDAAAPAPAVPFTPAGARMAGANKEAGVLDRDGNPQEGEGKAIEEVPTSRGRRIWVAIVWALTWWVPTPCLTYVGRMKRPDVRMAWREKVRLCAQTNLSVEELIRPAIAARLVLAHRLLLRSRHLLCVPHAHHVASEADLVSAADIIVFGRLLCPNYNKAWNVKELGYHSGTTDYWVGVRGNVYDLTKFYKIQCVGAGSPPTVT